MECVKSLDEAKGLPCAANQDGSLSSMNALQADARFLRYILTALVLSALMTGAAAAYAAISAVS